MSCFLCGRNNFVTKYTLSQGVIRVCKTCGIFIKIETDQTATKLYNDDYYFDYPYFKSFDLTKKYFQSKIERIKKLTGKISPYILDVGSGWGDFLEVVKGESLPYLGIDLSPIAIAKCQEKKLNVKKQTLEELFFQKKQFDAIVSFQTLEHVKNPVFFLKSAYKLLGPKGIILLTTPNNDSPLRFLTRGKWSVYNIESHFVFFTKKTLRLALEKADFTNISIRIDPPRFFSLGYILNRLRILDTRYSILDTFPIMTDPFGDLEAIAAKP